MITEKPWQSDPKVATKIAYLSLQILQFTSDVAPILQNKEYFRSLSRLLSRPNSAMTTNKRIWARTASALSALIFHKMEFHSNNAGLHGNLGFTGQLTIAPEKLSTYLNVTVQILESLLMPLEVNQDIAAAVMVQPCLEEAINIFNLTRYLAPTLSAELKKANDVFERAKVFPYLDSCVEYPTDIAKTKPGPRFTNM